MQKKKLVVLSGAGISAESGISTFRDANGLWEGHDVMEVASPEGWRKNRALVLEFYNQRRKNVIEAQPNVGHLLLAELEKTFDVHIITQNVDDLHERAGSTNVLHLHGEIRKCRSSTNPNLVYEMESWELKEGDKCPLGSQLRPHIVWFGEEVPLMEVAVELTSKADVFIVVGTSLLVYPAAGLLYYAPSHIQKFLIDPKPANVSGVKNLTTIAKGGADGMKELLNILSHLNL
jgi:NAD-dependent deacetylase